MRRGALAALALSLVVLLPGGGCGSKNEGHYVAQTVPVKGTITYKGKALTQGQITFEPENGREAHGTIQPDGTFVMTTFKEGDGAIAGTHRIAVRGTGKGGKDILPVKYRNASSSKVEIEVDGGKTEYPIDLK